MDTNNSAYAPLRPHVMRDVVTASLLLMLGLILLALGATALTVFPIVLPVTPDQLHWWHIVPLVLTCGATCWQSRYPLAVYGVITAGLALDMLLGLHLGVLLVWANSVYNAGRYTAGRTLRWSLVVFVVAVFGWIFAITGDVADAVSGMLQIVLTGIISLWWGIEVRSGDTRAETERLKSLAARRREIHEREVILRSHRADLAAQLHDTISSHLSTIALYTAGALEEQHDPEQHRKVLTQIRRSSLDALTDMRELIEVLRTFRAQQPLDETATTTTSQPATNVLDRLRSAGLDLTMVGDAQEHFDNRYDYLAQDKAILLEQVIQEALTNALKHGDMTAVLELRPSSAWMSCTISNPMTTAGRQRDSAQTFGITGGLGLGTMAATVHNHGGTFTAGVTTDPDHNRWTIDVALPIEHNTKYTSPITDTRKEPT